MTQSILVTGGNGTLGRAVVARLLAGGHQVQVLSRRPRPASAPAQVAWVTSDLTSGDGLAAAVADAQMIVHGATNPLQPRRVDIRGTANLLKAVQAAGTPHLRYISIVGVDRVPYRYDQAKLQAERLAALAIGPPSGRVPDMGGPQVRTATDLLRAHLHAAGRRRPVLPVRLPGAVFAAYRRGGHLAPDRAVGRRTWEELAADDLRILPYPSIWPFALGLGLTIALTGLVFGFWPLLLGGGLAAMGAFGWQAAVNREQRHRALQERQPAAAAHDRGAGPPRIVVAGAGYAGLHAALRLATRLRDNPEVALTVVDRHDYHQVLTELPRVAGGTRAAGAVRIPLEDVLSERVRFERTAITGFDLIGRRLLTEAGAIPYSRLVLTLGSRPNDFAIPGLAERALTLYSVQDAERVWQAVNDAVAAAAREPDPERQRRRATVVIGGGGATGVELAGELAEMLPEVARRHGLRPDRLRVVLVEAGPGILAGSSRALIDKAMKILEQLDVEVCTNAMIAEATEDGFRLKDCRLVQGGVFVWAGGVKAPDLVARSGLPVGHNGRVKVDQHLRVLDHPEIYAAGDVASVPDHRTGHVLPPLAQVALEEAETVANNLDAELEGRPLEAFTFHDKGFAVSVGPRRGVADIAGITMGGRLAHILKDAIEWEYRQSVRYLRGWDPLAL